MRWVIKLIKSKINNEILKVLELNIQKNDFRFYQTKLPVIIIFSYMLFSTLRYFMLIFNIDRLSSEISNPFRKCIIRAYLAFFFWNFWFVMERDRYNLSHSSVYVINRCISWSCSGLNDTQFSPLQKWQRKGLIIIVVTLI